MELCELHVEELNHALRSRGLWDFVSTSDEEIKAKMWSITTTQRATLENYDPKLVAVMMIMQNGLMSGGPDMLTEDAEGNSRCPICEAKKHNAHDWIERAAGSAKRMLKEVERGNVTVTKIEL